jgi:hypothetical protein
MIRPESGAAVAPPVGSKYWLPGTRVGSSSITKTKYRGAVTGNTATNDEIRFPLA